MRKILFIIPFFLWTCGGGESSPTSPEDSDGTDSGGTDPVSTGSWSLMFEDSEESNGSSVKETSDGKYVFTGSAGSSTSKNVLYGKVSSFGGSPILEWTKTADKSTGGGGSIEITNDGGYIITGVLESQIYILKVGNSGNLEWDTSYDTGTSYSRGAEIRQTSDGGYIIAGYDGKAFLLKINSTGGQEWIKTYDTSSDNSFFWSVFQTSDGGYIAGGEKGGTNRDAYIVKTDTSGNEEWSLTYGGVDRDAFKAVRQTSDGGYILSGHHTQSNTWLIKTDNQGTVTWENFYGAYGMVGGYLDITLDGGYILVGYTESFGDDHIQIVKTDASGNQEWEQFHGANIANGVKAFVAPSIKATSDGGYVIVGETQGNKSNMFMMKIDSSGNRIF